MYFRTVAFCVSSTSWNGEYFSVLTSIAASRSTDPSLDSSALSSLSTGLDSATIAIRRRSRLSSVLLASFRSISEYFS